MSLTRNIGRAAAVLLLTIGSAASEECLDTRIAGLNGEKLCY
jgi:hypothetical protein